MSYVSERGKMSKSRIDYIKKNIIWEVIYNIATAIFPFLVRTFTIYFLGADYLGLNSLCTSVLSVLNLANLGIDAAVLSYAYEAYGKNDVPEINALLNFYRKINRIIGAIILLGGLIIMPFLKKIASTDLPKDVNIQLIFLIYLISNCLTYEFSFYKKLIFNVSQRWDLHLKGALLSTSILNISQIFLIWRKQYYLSTLVMIGSTLVEMLYIEWIFKKTYPMIGCIGEIDKEIKHQVLKKLKGVVVYRLRDWSRNSADGIILSYYFGLVQLAKYQNYMTVLTVPSFMRTIFSHSVTNSLGNYLATEEKEDGYYIYKILLFVHLFLSGWFAICFYFLANDFIELWIGRQYCFQRIIVLLFAAYFYIIGITEIATILRRITGLWEQGKGIAVFEAISNLGLNILLARYFGIAGIIGATILTIGIICVPYEATIIIRGYFEQGYRESFNAVLKNILWIAFSAWGLFMTEPLMPDLLLWRLIIRAGTCIIIPILVQWLLYRRSAEYQYILKIIYSIFNKKNA